MFRPLFRSYFDGLPPQADLRQHERPYASLGFTPRRTFGPCRGTGMTGGEDGSRLGGRNDGGEGRHETCPYGGGTPFRSYFDGLPPLRIYDSTSGPTPPMDSCHGAPSARVGVGNDGGEGRHETCPYGGGTPLTSTGSRLGGYATGGCFVCDSADNVNEMEVLCAWQSWRHVWPR